MATRLLGATLLSAAVLACLPGSAHAVRIDYSLDFGIERNDNLLLTADNEVETTILRPGLGFVLTEATSTWQADFTGRAEYLDYRDDRFDNSLESFLSGRLNWVALPDRLSFTLEDDLSVQPVNTLLPDTPGNRQQINVVSVGPTLLFGLGTLRGAADLRYINSRAEVTDEFDTDRLNFGLRAIKAISPVSELSGNLQLQRVDFDDDVVGRDYDRADLFARYTRRLASMDLALDAGVSRIDYRRGDESRTDPLFRAQGTWRWGGRHELDLRLSSQFSDSAADALSGIDPTTAVPGSVQTGDAVIAASPYQERGVELRYTLTTPRVTASIAPYYERLRYVDEDEFDQNNYGGSGEITLQLRPRLSVGTYAVVGRVSYVHTGRVDQTREAAVFAEYEWTRHLSSRLSLARHERDVSVFGDDAKQNIALLTFTYRNR